MTINQLSYPTTGAAAAIWQHQGDDLTECERERPYFATTFSGPFKDQSGARSNGSSLGLNDLEALMNVAFEAKEWINAYAILRVASRISSK